MLSGKTIIRQSKALLSEDTVLGSDENEIRQIVRAILRDALSWFDEDDPLVVEQQIRQVRVSYAPSQASRGSPSATFLECRLDLDSSEMWIGHLQVAVARRWQGLGRELVGVAERIAAALEMREINIFPLSGSVDFWRKMRYIKKPQTPRVFCKHVVERE